MYISSGRLRELIVKRAREIIVQRKHAELTEHHSAVTCRSRVVPPSITLGTAICC